MQEQVKLFSACLAGQICAKKKLYNFFMYLTPVRCVFTFWIFDVSYTCKMYTAKTFPVSYTMNI